MLLRYGQGDSSGKIWRYLSRPCRNVEQRFDTNCKAERPLLMGRNKEVGGLMEDVFDGTIMKNFVAMRPKNTIIS